jgi:hypothetical protein
VVVALAVQVDQQVQAAAQELQAAMMLHQELQTQAVAVAVMLLLLSQVVQAVQA